VPACFVKKFAFTDGSELVARWAVLPFYVDEKTVVQLFTVDGIAEKALFGLPERTDSISLKLCFEWNRKSGFRQNYFIHWRDYFSQSGIKNIIDKREPGKPIAICVNKRGDIISSQFLYTINLKNVPSSSPLHLILTK